MNGRFFHKLSLAAILDRPQMDNILPGIETLLFCDESKFYINDGDFEDAIYYFAVSVEKRKVPDVNREFKAILAKHKVQFDVYHSTTAFKKSRPRPDLMNDLVQLIIQNRLNCFCYKYSKSLFFEPTKHLTKFNNDIISFKKVEFQALFYFLTILNTYVRDFVPNLLKREISMYFDRNVYGVSDIEAFKFPSEDFVLKQMTFTEKSLISLLSLPDFLGYIFRNSKKSQNKVQFGDKSIEVSNLVINSYKGLADINTAGLFRFIDVDKNILGKALQIDIE